jgi:hypothetical protein
MSTLDEIAAVARVMEGFPGPWFVSGGWAIDLFVGQVTREHEDQDSGIFREDQEALRAHLAGWDLYRVEFRPGGNAWVPWPTGAWMKLREFQVQARRSSGEPREFELFMNDQEGGVWQCRRNAAITRPVAEIWFRSQAGIPTLLPEIQLLFKAKRHHPKDEHDFEQAVPLLTHAQRSWLKEQLALVYPGDAWIERL